MDPPARSALINPREMGCEELRLQSREVSLTAVFAALYVAINVVQMFSIGNPLISGPIQLRVADCLIALAALLGWPVVFGVTTGCVVANVISNMMYFLGPIDIIMGPFANLVAASLVFLFWRRRLLACVVGALPVGLIVGGYLWWFFDAPEVLAFMPAWLGMIASITLSSLIAVTVIGYSLLTILSRPSIVEPLKSRGLEVLEKS
ncbi:MAG: QueT transporter family protein [Candidatus Bathyarchaeota archaeon]|nr:MAG: QueT transporter family protein [Candidatus Bathyarchaeota archaeon]